MVLQPKIAPSILSVDFARPGGEVQAADQARADCFVAGSTVFGAHNYGEAMAGLRAQA